MKKGTKMKKPHKCNCLYCGEEFYSVRPSGKFHKTSCRINFFEEKKEFISKIQHKFISNINKLIKPYSIEKIKTIEDVGLVKILTILKDNSDNSIKNNNEIELRFIKYLKTKNKNKKNN